MNYNSNINTRTLLLILTILFSLFFDLAYANDGCNNYDYKYTKGEPDVRLISQDSNEFYIIQSSMKNVFNDKNYVLYKRLNLVNKQKLFLYLVPTNKEKYEVYLNKWTCNNINDENSEKNLICCVNTGDVKIVKKIVKETTKILNTEKIDENKTSESRMDNDIELLSNLNFENAFVDEINFVKNFIKLNPKSISAHEYLYSLYKMNGMLEEADEISDLIFDLKLNNFN